MKYVICVVRDSAADAYGVPMFVSAIGTAIRSFAGEVNRESPDNLLFKNSDDFELFHLGYYDDDGPSFDLLPAPKSLLRGSDAKDPR